MLRSISRIEKEFGKRRQVLIPCIQEDGADLSADGCSAGLSRAEYGNAESFEPTGQSMDLRCLPTPFDSLKRNEHSTFLSLSIKGGKCVELSPAGEYRRYPGRNQGTSFFGKIAFFPLFFVDNQKKVTNIPSLPG
jgi:hypothetical protein